MPYSSYWDEENKLYHIMFEGRSIKTYGEEDTECCFRHVSDLNRSVYEKELIQRWYNSWGKTYLQMLQRERRWP